MKKSFLKKYAKLIALMGANIKKGQTALVYAQTDQHIFANMVAEELYKAGASRVVMKWEDQQNQRLRYFYEDEKTLSNFHKWEEEEWKEIVDELPARIYIESEDPDGLTGVPIEKMQNANSARMKKMKPFRDAIENRHQWTIAAVPSQNWAKKIFPNESKRNAMEMLWTQILTTCRIDEKCDPVEAWKNHNRTLLEKCNKLNSFHFEYLHYESSNGTDFKCHLIPQALWLGGEEKTLDGTCFNPNMPTEEIFTTPMKGKCEGKLVATMPLSYMGNLIENFSLTFKDGKAVDCDAQKGEELLRKMISMDENAAYVGELALVPMDSPISNSGILFYSTLFDENASCHVALGRGFDNCIKDCEKFTQKQIKEMGVNDSIIHVDFMIGAKDLKITGYKEDGSAVTIFMNGNWAI